MAMRVSEMIPGHSLLCGDLNLRCSHSQDFCTCGLGEKIVVHHQQGNDYNTKRKKQ